MRGEYDEKTPKYLLDTNSSDLVSDSSFNNELSLPSRKNIHTKREKIAGERGETKPTNPHRDQGAHG